MIVVGELALWVALFLSAWTTAASIAGRALDRSELVASGVRGLYAATAMVALASLGLWAALLTHDFAVAYVAAHTTENTPTLYLIVAFWAGPAGATLALALALATCGTVAIAGVRDAEIERRAHVTGALGVILTMTLVAVCFAANPYDRVEWVPADGRGLYPRLQNAWAALHPPAMLSGYAATAVPFAFTVAAIAGRHLDGEWSGVLRRWSFVSWLLLTLGLASGMRWTYVEPEWGGLWPRESRQLIAVLPWLMIGALLRSSSVSRPEAARERTISSLALGTFLVVVGTAGVMRRTSQAGAHAFIRAPTAGWILIALALAAAIASLSLLARLPRGSERVAQARRWHRPSPIDYVLCTGVGLLLVGLLATGWWSTASVRLRAGAAIELTDAFGGRWRFVSQGVSRDQGMNYLSTGLALEAWRGGDRIGILSSEQRQYFDGMQRPTFEPSTKPGIRSFARLDVYVTLVDVRGEVADVRIGFHPLVACVWLGWLLVIVGGAAAAVTSARPTTTLAVPAPARAG